MRGRSLRTRLFLYVIGGAAALVAAAGLGLTWTIGAWLQDEFDRGLEATAQALIALTEQDGSRVEFDFDREVMPQFAREAGPEYFELWLADGTLVSRSPSFERSEDSRRRRLLQAPAPATVPLLQDVALPDGRRGRQLRIDFVLRGFAEATSPRLAATLIVARERLRLDADLRRLSIAVATFAAVLLVALAALTHLALRVGLRSLDQLGGQVRALDATSLRRRIEIERPPGEIVVVVDQVNALLHRLEASFARERRLSSDIAHELKTPIAELRSLCEVGARWPGDRKAVQGFFEDSHGIALQMERIVAHLLALARYDEGREQIQAVPVHVAQAVEAAWKPLARAAADKGLEYRPRISSTLWWQTDPDKFELMVGNILSNAVTHSPPGTVIDCVSDEANGRASLTCSNRAETLEADDLAVMFDRFWRKEEARTGGQHAGLGLALVRAMADVLAMEVVTRLEPDRTFRITLREPAGHQNRNCASTLAPQAPDRDGKAAPGKK